MGNKERWIIEEKNYDFLECNSLPLKWSRSKDYLKPTHKGFYSPCYFQWNFLAKRNQPFASLKKGLKGNKTKLLAVHIANNKVVQISESVKLDWKHFRCLILVLLVRETSVKLADPRWMLTAGMEVTEIPLSPCLSPEFSPQKTWVWEKPKHTWGFW